MHKLSSYLFHARATLTLGLPLIGSHVAQFVLHLTDTVMLGWYGVLPLAAGVLGASSFFTIFVLGSGFAKAVMPMVASANSQGDERQVRRVARMGLWLSILLIVVLAAQVSTTAALFFAPYLIWVAIAGLLNRSIVRLNGPF